jgi:hypothetical protein
MDTSSFDNQITKITSEIALTRQQMEPVSQSFIHAAKISTAAWCKEKVEKVVSTQPDAIRQLGQSGVPKLKSDLEKFYHTLSQAIEATLNESRFWNHRENYDPEENQEMNWIAISDGASFSGITPLSHAIEQLLGGLAAVFSKHGFNVLPPDHFVSERKSQYAWSDDMRVAARQYAKLLHDRWYMLESELAQVRQRKLDAEAQDLWRNT